MKQKRQFTVECASTDYGQTITTAITLPDGRSGVFNVTCGRPTYSFQTISVGFVPIDVIITTVEQCRVLGNNFGESEKRVHSRAEHKAVTHSRLPRAQGWGIALVGGAILGGILGVPPRSGGGKCRECPQLQADLNGLQAQLVSDRAEFNQATRSFHATLGQFNGAIVNVLEQVNDITGNTADMVEEMLEGFETSLNVSARLADFQALQGRELDRAFAIAQNQINDVRLSATETQFALQQLGLDTNRSITDLYNFTTNALGKIHEQMSEFKNITEINFADNKIIVNRITEFQANTMATVRAMAMRSEERVALTELVHDGIASLASSHANLRPFFTRNGVAPTDISTYLTASSRVRTVDTITMRYISPTNGGTPSRAVNLVLTYKCSIAHLIDRTYATSDSETVLKFIGPSSCRSDQPDTCWCFIEAQATHCSAISSFDTSLRSSFENAETLSNNFNGMCTGSIVSVQQTYKSASSFIEFMMSTSFGFPSVCTDYRRPSDGGLVAATGYIRSHSARKQGRTSFDPSLCAMGNDVTLKAIMAPASQISNPILSILQFMSLARKVAHINADTLAIPIEGTMPVGITFREEPFTMRPHPNNASLIVAARCLTASFASTTADRYPLNNSPAGTVEVFRVVPVGVTTTVTSSITVFNNDVGNTQTTSVASVADVVLNVPLERILPSGEFHVVGNPAATDFVYDVAQADFSVGSASSTRAGTVMYLVGDTRDDSTNHTDWVRRNGNVFVASDAQNAPFVHRRAVSPEVGGPCINGTNAICAIRDSFVVQVTGNGFTARPRGGSYTAIIDAPEGDVTFLYSQRCPTVTYGSRTSQGVELIFSAHGDSTQATNVVVEDAHVSLACQAIQRPTRLFTIQPGSIVTFFSAGLACSGAQRVHVSIARNDVRTRCTLNPIDVTPREATDGAVDEVRVLSIASTKVDVAAVESNALLMQILTLMTTNTVNNVETLSALGLPVPNEVFTTQFNSLALIGSLINATNTRFGNITTLNTTFGEDGRRLNESVSDQIASAANSAAQAREQLELIRASQANFSVALVQQRELLANLSVASDRLVLASENLGRTQDNITATSIKFMSGIFKEVKASRASGSLFNIGNLDSAFRGAANALGDAGEAAVDLLGDIVNFVCDDDTKDGKDIRSAGECVKAVARTVNDAAGGLFDGVGGIFNIIITIVVIGAVLAGAYFVWSNWAAFKHMKELHKKANETKGGSESHMDQPEMDEDTQSRVPLKPVKPKPTRTPPSAIGPYVAP